MKKYFPIFVGLVAMAIYTHLALVTGDAQTASSKVSNESFQNSNITEGPPMRANRIKYAYDGSDFLIYRGWAASTNRRTEWGINAGSLVNVIDATTTSTINFGSSHCLEVGNQVAISGASDADLNTSYSIASVTDADTVTVTSANVTDATYNASGLIVYTISPRTCDTVWSIKRYTNDANGNPIDESWGLGSAQGFNLAWDSRTSYAYH